MPSRPAPPFLPPQPSPLPYHQLSSSLIPPLAAASTAAFSFLLLFVICFRKLTRKRTVPTDFSKPPHRFSYTTLRRATNKFSPSLRLGQGGFGSVYHGTLPNELNVAVKVMDSGSLQGEREFQNELLFASKLDSCYIVTALGFSYDRKHRSLLIVYELMQNGNLQDALLHRQCVELVDWKKRFSIAVDIAKGIEYLHSLDPPVIHGDIKPSNILLDQCFNAKVADFGLAWLKIDNSNQNDQNQCNQGQCEVKVEESDKINGGVELKKVELESNNGGEDYGSVVEETDSVTTGFDEFNLVVDQLPVCMTSPETLEAVSASPETGGVGVLLEGNLDVGSIEGGKELVNGEKNNGGGIQSESRKDWRLKQEKGGTTAENGGVKDYVMEWLGTEINKGRPKSDWIGASSSSNSQSVGKIVKKKNRKRLDWWVSLDDDKGEKVLKKEKRRPAREWWKEEYCEELEKKNKKKKKKREMGMTSDDNNGGEDWWPRDEELYAERKKKRSKSRGSRGSIGSIEWFSGELFRGNRNSHDSLSGEIPESGGISSTPSMRGTVCYAAPEYGGGGNLSEKSDVYSFGVLLLVLIAGRRPLQVTTLPMSEFQRANLMHWARNLARSGKLLDLVDKSVQSLDREQATLCITIALLCLQKSPAHRPSMTEVVGMLTGESHVPQLPSEFSPSPPTRFPFKSKSHQKEWQVRQMLLVSDPCMKHELDPLQSFCKICGHKIVHWKCNQCFSSGMASLLEWRIETMMSFSKLHTQASYVYINGKDSQGLLQFNEDVTMLWYFLTRISRLKDAVVEIPDCCIHGAALLLLVDAVVFNSVWFIAISLFLATIIKVSSIHLFTLFYAYSGQPKLTQSLPWKEAKFILGLLSSCLP